MVGCLGPKSQYHISRGGFCCSSRKRHPELHRQGAADPPVTSSDSFSRSRTSNLGFMRIEVRRLGTGHHVYNTMHNAYVEIIPYQKVLADAKRRKRVLLDQLRADLIANRHTFLGHWVAECTGVEPTDEKKQHRTARFRS